MWCVLIAGRFIIFFAPKSVATLESVVSDGPSFPSSGVAH